MGQTKVGRAIQDFVILPAIVLVGIYVTASLIDQMFLVDNTAFRILFADIVGVNFLFQEKNSLIRVILISFQFQLCWY